MLGLDSTHRLSIAALRAAGITVVGRYLGPFRKATSYDEDRELAEAGIGRFYYWETTATRALDGQAAGAADGTRARQAANGLHNVPATHPLVWTVDTDVNGYGQVAAYDDGFHGTSHASGPYGEADVIDGSVAAGRSSSGVQTNARGWDQPRRVSPHASIRQHVPVGFTGGDVDPVDVDPGSPLVLWPHAPTPPPAPGWAPPAYPGHCLKQGDESQDVAVLKLMLIVAGYGRDVNVEGDAAHKFGPGTRRAVARLQGDAERNAGLPVRPDGIACGKTWGWLGDILLVKHNLAAHHH